MKAESIISISALLAIIYTIVLIIAIIWTIYIVSHFVMKFW